MSRSDHESEQKVFEESIITVGRKPGDTRAVIDYVWGVCLVLSCVAIILLLFNFLFSIFYSKLSGILCIVGIGAIVINLLFVRLAVEVSSTIVSMYVSQEETKEILAMIYYAVAGDKENNEPTINNVNENRQANEQSQEKIDTYCTFECPNCGLIQDKIPNKHLGKIVKCPKCKQIVQLG